MWNNFAAGVEHRLREDLQVYGAFSTDFNAADNKGQDNTAFGEFDLYHLSGGATFMAGSSELTLGGTLTFSDATTQEFEKEGLLPAELTFSHLRFSFIVGFQLPF